MTQPDRDETPRARARRRTLAEITRIGREHLVRDGVAQLSLRAVARDLGVVSSAVYRYVADRDALLTLLVVDAYDELGEEVERAVEQVTDPREQLVALGRAARAWSVREPARFALLYGTPVAGYAAPPERTVGPGTRVVLALVGVLVRAHAAGLATLDDEPALPASLRADLRGIREQMHLDVPDALVARGLFAWAALFGAIGWEVFDHYGRDTVGDLEGLFEHHLRVLGETVGFNQMPPGPTPVA